jgi:hypothetical protein
MGNEINHRLFCDLYNGMECGNIMREGCRWLRGLTDCLMTTANVGSETESMEMELRAAASRQGTSQLEKAQADTEEKSSMEMFTAAPGTTVSSASHTITKMTELHDESLQPEEAAETVQELEDEISENEKYVKSTLEEMDSQLMEFRKIIQAKDKIISELKNKLDLQKCETGRD